MAHFTMWTTFRSLLESLFPWMASPSSPEDINGLHLSRGTALDTLADIVMAHPEDYKHLLLQGAALCDTDTIIPHELIVFKFYCTLEDGTIRYYFVVADRVTIPETGGSQQTSRTPGAGPLVNSADSTPSSSTILTRPSAPQRLNRSRSTRGGSNDSWESLRKPAGDADDRLRQWAPRSPAGPNWWKGAYGSSSSPAANARATFSFDPTDTDMTESLTLIDVVLALCSVSQVAPAYSFKKHNCWWLARCSLLLLFLRQHQSPLSRNPMPRSDIEAEYFGIAKTTVIPFPDSLNAKVIKADTVVAEANFITLRARVDTQLQKYNELRHGAERSNEAERRATQAERIAAREAEQREAAERLAHKEAEQRAAAEQEAYMLANAFRERGIDPATITNIKIPIGRVSDNFP